MMIVGVVAGAVTQVQRSIEVLRMRSEAGMKVEAAFSDLEHDLAHMVSDLTVPAAFSTMTPVPVPLALGANAVGGQPLDPTGLSRHADTVTVFTITPSGQRAVVEYCLDGSSDTSPTFTAPPGGGLWVSRLRRHILGAAVPGDTTATKEPAFQTTGTITVGGSTITTPMVMVDNVVSFGITYIAAGTRRFTAPSGALNFVSTGNLKVAGYSAHNDNGDVLSGVPVGYPIEFAVNGSWTTPTSTFTVRRWTGGSLSAVPPKVTDVLLNDHVVVSSTIPGNGEVAPATVTQTVPARAFTPPVALGVTFIVRYGTGPNAPIMTFRREIPVSRS
jgi:hypothetical protein